MAMQIVVGLPNTSAQAAEYRKKRKRKKKGGGNGKDRNDPGGEYGSEETKGSY